MYTTETETSGVCHSAGDVSASVACVRNEPVVKIYAGAGCIGGALSTFTGSSDDCLSVSSNFRFRILCPGKAISGDSPPQAGSDAYMPVSVFSASSTCGGSSTRLPLGCASDPVTNRSAMFSCSTSHAIYQAYSRPDCDGVPVFQQFVAHGSCGALLEQGSYSIDCGGASMASGGNAAAMSALSLVTLVVAALVALHQ
jgi:hypothetical protein